MAAVHGYNFGEHHGTTIRLAHGRAVVIAAWRPTTRITILLPYGNQPLEGSKWRRTMRCGPTWLMTLVGHHTARRWLVTVHATRLCVQPCIYHRYGHQLWRTPHGVAVARHHVAHTCVSATTPVPP